MTVALAPGKLVLSGSYAVLEGAPALVVAVDRYARADTSKPSEKPTREVLEALSGRAEDAPSWEADELYEGGTKLGLGSSAAILVASLGAREASRGADLEDPDVRSKLFARARAAHAEAQGGGSGVDVAAATYGGVLRYSLHAGRAWVLTAELPEDLVLQPYFSGTSARTSDLLDVVRAFREREPASYAQRMADLGYASELTAERMQSASVREIVAAIESFGRALEQLGDAADADIVPLSFKRLAGAAGEEGGTFVPSGAGGGDLGVFFGPAAPSERFAERAAALGMRPVHLGIDRGGVRLSPLKSGDKESS